MKKLVVLLHGVGSSGADLEGLGHFFQQMMPEIIFAAPNGAEPFSGGGGYYQWFSLDGVTPENRPARIREARDGFDTIINGILHQHDFKPGEDKLILLGFSQGSIMALDALVSARFPLTAVVAFSGRLASPKPYHPAPETAVLLVHGLADNVISWHESEAASAALIEAGSVDVQTQFEPNVAHTISAEGIGEAMAFIAQHFGVEMDDE